MRPLPSTRQSATRRSLLAGLAASTVALAGCSAPFVPTRTQTAPADVQYDGTPSRLVLRDLPHAVSVQGSDRADAVSGTRRASGGADPTDLAVSTDLADGTLTVATSLPADADAGRFDLELTVPGDLPVERVETRDGSVSVAGVTGGPTIRIDDGSVSVDEVAGDATVATGDGSVSVADVHGFVAVDSDDGSVSVDDVEGVVGVETATGSVSTDVPALRGDAAVRSGDGSVSVTLGADLDAHVTASTGDGVVSGADALDSVEQSARTRVAGTVGAGTHDLEVRTADGSVSLDRQQ